MKNYLKSGTFNNCIQTLCMFVSKKITIILMNQSSNKDFQLQESIVIGIINYSQLLSYTNLYFRVFSEKFTSTHPDHKRRKFLEISNPYYCADRKWRQSCFKSTPINDSLIYYHSLLTCIKLGKNGLLSLSNSLKNALFTFVLKMIIKRSYISFIFGSLIFKQTILE